MTSSTSSPISTTTKPATTSQPSSTTSKPISTTAQPSSTTSTPRPTTSSASTTQKPVSYGECYPNSLFTDETEEFNQICTFACSKNVCLSFYCDCEENMAPTQQSTTLMSILTSTPSPPSSTSSPSSSSSSSLSSSTTQSSKKCQDVKVTEAYKNIAGMLDWCIQQCFADSCTPTHCVC